MENNNFEINVITEISQYAVSLSRDLHTKQVTLSRDLYTKQVCGYNPALSQICYV